MEATTTTVTAIGSTTESSYKTITSPMLEPTVSTQTGPNTSAVIRTTTTIAPTPPLEAILLLVAAAAVIIISALVFLLYKKCGLTKGFRRLLLLRERAASTTSHQKLHNEDAESMDLPPPRTERELFSIGDTEDLDMRTGAGPDDGYFYDEIYERSAFVDELTNCSLKELHTSIYKGKNTDPNDLNYKVSE